MKNGLDSILGKTITGIIANESEHTPKSQVFLLFQDNTYTEFYCLYDTIHGIGGVRRGDINDVKKIIGDDHNIVFEKYQS